MQLLTQGIAKEKVKETSTDGAKTALTWDLSQLENDRHVGEMDAATSGFALC